jgi:hypothetical protein
MKGDRQRTAVIWQYIVFCTAFFLLGLTIWTPAMFVALGMVPVVAFAYAVVHVLVFRGRRFTRHSFGHGATMFLAGSAGAGLNLGYGGALAAMWIASGVAMLMGIIALAVQMDNGPGGDHSRNLSSEQRYDVCESLDRQSDAG